MCHSRPKETQNTPVSPFVDLRACGRRLTSILICSAVSKREDLINQIKDQHGQIKELMAKLESSGARSRRRPSSAESSDDIASTSALQSPTTISPSSASDSHSPTDSDSGGDKAIEIWIAKAKQSLQEFDVFISAGMPKSYIIEDESWDDDSDDDYVNVTVSGDEYEIAVENPDGGDVVEVAEGNLKHKVSTSSISTNGTGILGKNRKRNAKPVILPSEAVPFGLFGQLSLQTPESNAEADDDGEKGIAGKNYFRPSQLYFCFPFGSLLMNFLFLQLLLRAWISN